MVIPNRIIRFLVHLFPPTLACSILWTISLRRGTFRLALALRILGLLLDLVVRFGKASRKFGLLIAADFRGDTKVVKFLVPCGPIEVHG